VAQIGHRRNTGPGGDRHLQLFYSFSGIYDASGDGKAATEKIILKMK
jgi:hypothetical protein